MGFLVPVGQLLGLLGWSSMQEEQHLVHDLPFVCLCICGNPSPKRAQPLNSFVCQDEVSICTGNRILVRSFWRNRILVRSDSKRQCMLTE